MKLRALLFILPVSIILTSCGSSSDSGVATTRYKGNSFSMEVPTSWVAVDSKALPATKNGTVELALTSPDISSGFANNLLVLKDTVSATENGEKMTSKRYGIVNHALTTGSYKEYVKISDSAITFTDGDEWNLYVFEAKYHDATPKKRFVQTSKICGDSVYLITIGVDLGINASGKYEDLAKSFACEK